jgi:hypothetical protein
LYHSSAQQSEFCAVQRTNCAKSRTISCISRIVQKCTIREESLNLLNYSKMKQIVPSSQIWFYGLDWMQKSGKLLPSAQSSPQGQQKANSG